MTDARQSRVSAAFVTLADSLVTGYDVVDLLRSLVDYCVDLLDAAAAGLVLHDAKGAMEVLAATSEGGRLLELLQLETGQGPCMECYATGAVVSVPDVASEARWPEFSAKCLEEGYRSVHAVPMRLRDQVIGALNLFRTEPGALPEDDARLAQALTDVATIAIMQERALRHSTLLAEQLQGALNSRILIEQAKGVLAQQRRLDMDEAFTVLRGYARRESRALREVAAAVVSGRLDPAAMDS